MWAYSPQNGEKMVFFWYKFAPKGKFWGSTEKVEYRCTTTNLRLCSDGIIVWKLHCIIAFPLSQTSSFQIVTKTDKNITFFILQPARDPRSPPYLAWW